jgi:hypothetical protein
VQRLEVRDQVVEQGAQVHGLGPEAQRTQGHACGLEQVVAEALHAQGRTPESRSGSLDDRILMLGEHHRGHPDHR